MAQPTVLYTVEDKVAIITLNRPEKMNALNHEMWVQIDESFVKADEDPEIRAIALVGEGRAFSTGADLNPGQDPTEILPWMAGYEKHNRRQFRMWDSGKTIVCGIHGYAIGRGLELALWCDIVVAAEETKLGQSEVREGWIVHSVVPWLTNPQSAKLFMMSGDLIGAREAERMGLVARVVETGKAREEAIKLAKRLTHVPPITARAVKQMINGVYEQLGFRGQQLSGVGMNAAISSLTPEEKGTQELVRIRNEQGLKASLKFRDAPFEK